MNDRKKPRLPAMLQTDFFISSSPSFKDDEGRSIDSKLLYASPLLKLELAPHCWGSALSFNAGVALAFASSAARTVEYSLGGNPLLREMPIDPPVVEDGVVLAPTAPGFGIEPRSDFLDEYEVK